MRRPTVSTGLALPTPAHLPSRSSRRAGRVFVATALPWLLLRVRSVLQTLTTSRLALGRASPALLSSPFPPRPPSLPDL